MPEHIRAEPDIRFFRKLLKTHLFNLAFNVYTDILDFIVCDSWNAPVMSEPQMHWMIMMMMMTYSSGALWRTIQNKFATINGYPIIFKDSKFSQHKI